MLDEQNLINNFVQCTGTCVGYKDNAEDEKWKNLQYSGAAKHAASNLNPIDPMFTYLSMNCR